MNCECHARRGLVSDCQCVTCAVSRVRCHVCGVTCAVSRVRAPLAPVNLGRGVQAMS